MSSRRHLFLALVGLVVAVGCGWTFLVRPAYREAALLEAQVHGLQAKGNLADRKARAIELLKARLAERKRVLQSLKRIPASPDIAELMLALSQPDDGVQLDDQTFTAGQPSEAVPRSRLPFRAVPLTVEIVGRFEAIFLLLHEAESLPRLVRPSLVEILCKRTAINDEPFADATIVLDVIYNPTEEDG